MSAQTVVYTNAKKAVYSMSKELTEAGLFSWMKVCRAVSLKAEKPDLYDKGLNEAEKKLAEGITILDDKLAKSRWERMKEHAFYAWNKYVPFTSFISMSKKELAKIVEKINPSLSAKLNAELVSQDIISRDLKFSKDLEAIPNAKTLTGSHPEFHNSKDRILSVSPGKATASLKHIGTCKPGETVAFRFGPDPEDVIYISRHTNQGHPDEFRISNSGRNDVSLSDTKVIKPGEGLVYSIPDHPVNLRYGTVIPNRLEINGDGKIGFAAVGSAPLPTAS